MQGLKGLKVGLSGATGKMGRAITELLSREEALLSFALGLEGEKDLGSPAAFYPDISYTTLKNLSWEEPPEVIIDFSFHEFTISLLRTLEDRNYSGSLVIGTTGFTEKEKEAIEKLANNRPIFLSTNMSLGVAILRKTIQDVSKLLPDFHKEILEIHHAEKKDAPSGTALSLLSDLKKDEDRVVYGRQGSLGARDFREIGVMALRGGDVVGEHTVYFFGPGERLEFSHKATSREVFAQGALKASSFIRLQKPGLYTMNDLLSFLTPSS